MQGRRGALVQREAGYRYAAAWAIPVPLLVLDDTTIVFANAAFARWLGHEDAGSLIGRDLDEFLHSDVRASSAARREVVAGSLNPLSGVPTKMLTRSGNSAKAAVSARPVQLDDATLVLAEFQADNVGSPDSLPEPPDLGRDAEELGAMILEELSAPVLIHSPAKVLLMNRAARKALGFSERCDVEGKAVVSLMHQDAMYATIERMAYFFAVRKPILGVPVKLKATDGNPVRAIADAYPIRSGRATLALTIASLDQR